MRRERDPLKVFLTIDTELWPITPGWKKSGLEEEARFYIHGETRSGSFGLPYQLDVFRQHKLKAVFFTESLFSTVIARERLNEIVALIHRGGQEVQLHIHTEWLRLLEQGEVSYMKDFREAEQLRVIRLSTEMLIKSGCKHIRAFRAGNYGADNATLSALHAAGIPFDTSYNPAFLNSQCAIRTDSLLLQPARLNGTWELPVSSFYDFGSHVRPAQLCACSADEMWHALESAWNVGWHSFVVVFHSFELLQKSAEGLAKPNKLVISRFERLCSLLDSHRDRFLTMGFENLPDPATDNTRAIPLRSHPFRTAVRIAEQTLGRFQ